MSQRFLRVSSLLFLYFFATTISYQSAIGRTLISETEKFQMALAEFTEAFKRLDAFSAPYYEVEENLSSFGDSLTPEALARPAKLYAKTLATLNQIDASKLTGHDVTTYSILKSDLENRLEGEKFPSYYLSTHFRGSRLLSFIDETSPNLTSFPFDSKKHYEDFLKKTEGLAPYVDRLIATLNEGVSKGYVLNCEIAKKTVTTLQPATNSDVEKNPFFRPALKFPDGISTEDQALLRKGFKEAITQKIIPAYAKAIDFLNKDYMPKCRAEYGYGTLPDGKKWYEYAIRQRTDLPYSPKDLHNLGLAEVARIKKQIDVIAGQLGYSGTTKEFLTYMVNNADYQFSTKEEIQSAFEAVKEKISPKISDFFVTIPKSDYIIVPSENPNNVGASYQTPTDSIPYGRFVYNGLNPKATNLYDITTLSMHEAVPGHHFHLALAYENKKKLSEYQRRLFYSTAFTEGWGLYAESLGDEMKMFTDPVQKFGNLNYELLRAVRLVVDTGIHYLGWSRQETIQYMTDNLAKSAAYIEGEADRYSVWPGQALAYKVGELKIRELRELAKTKLGTKFDIRKFHEIVLDTGTLPLPVLEEKVLSWIKSVK